MLEKLPLIVFVFCRFYCTSRVPKLRLYLSLYGLPKAGMHNIRPAGQMCPAKAFKLALKALIHIGFGLIFVVNTI